MKLSSPGLFNVSIMRASSVGENKDVAPTDGVRSDLRMLKTALLYGDNIDLITPSALEWRFWLDFEDPAVVRPEFKLAVLEEISNRALGAGFTLDGLDSELAGKMFNTGLAYVDQLRRALRSEESKVSPSSAARFYHQLDALWPLLAAAAGPTYVPGLRTIRELVAGDRITLAHAFDPSIIPSDEWVRSHCEFEITSDDQMEAAKLALAVMLRTEQILADPQVFPVFDDQIGALAEGLSRTAREAAVPLAGHFFGRLPQFEKASMDEILDIRTELEPHLLAFQRAVAAMSVEIVDVPDSEFDLAAEKLWMAEVLPGLQEIDEMIQENKYLRELGAEMLSKPQAALTAAGIYIGVTHTDAFGLIGGSLLAGLPAAKVALDYAKERSKIGRHKFFFLHQLSSKLGW